MKIIGTWWNDSSIQLVKIDSIVYGLNGWNGERYTDCFKVKRGKEYKASKETYTLVPIYECKDQEDDYIIEIIDYEVINN